jgi:adenylosuccinate lyase
MSREDAYALVQKHALAAWDGGASLEERVRQDQQVTAVMSEADIGSVFDLSRHLKEVDRIINRALI